MGMQSRERDFTDGTVEDLLSSLSGPTEESRAFRDFWANYGACFDTVDFSGEAAQIDEFISRNRYLMSEVTPTKLKEVSAKMHALDESFAREVDTTTQALQAYGKSLDALTEAISDKGFPASFSKNKLNIRLHSIKTTIVSEKDEFVKNMQEQFGFNEETSILMWRIYEVIRNQYVFETKEKLGWAFNRLLGGMVYGSDDIKDAFMWNETAGIPFYFQCGDVNDLAYFKSKGFTEKEYYTLKGDICIQHFFSENRGVEYTWEDFVTEKIYNEFKENMENIHGQLSEDKLEDLWNTYRKTMEGQTDFAHQSITTAAIFAKELKISSGTVEWYTGADSGKMAGWLGDATLPDFTFDYADYRADLDAENIIYYMKIWDCSYVETASRYYEYINTTGNRTTAFLSHTPIEEVEMDIMERMNRKAENKLTNRELLELRDNDKKRKDFIDTQYNNETYLDTYRFLQTLWAAAETDTPMHDMVK